MRSKIHSIFCAIKRYRASLGIPNQEISLSTDAERLKEILSNLLQNASNTPIAARLRCARWPKAKGDKIRFEIADTGPGNPGTICRNDFEPFIQVRRSSTEISRGGIGLGLSIVKKHVEQIKGTIEVASELGEARLLPLRFPAFSKKQGARTNSSCP